MAMTPYGGDPLVISKLGTTPQERGLSPEQFKGKFDEGLKGFVEWFNLTHKTEFEAKAEQDDLEDLAGAERTIETVKGNADAIEAHEAENAGHNATSAATASRIMMRDAAGRAQVATPSAAADIARKDTVDAVQANLTAIVKYPTAGGTANAITIAQTGFTKVDGAKAWFKASSNNTSTMTANVNSTGASAIKDVDGVALAASAIISGRYYEIIWNNSLGFFVLAPKGGGATIKSIQRGEADWNNTLTSKDITIGSIDPNKAIATVEIYTTGAPNVMATSIEIINATTIRIKRITGTAQTNANFNKVTWKVIEYENVKSKQSGIHVPSVITPESITISEIDPGKSILVHSMTSTSTSTTAPQRNFLSRAWVNSATTIMINAEDIENTVYWQLLEFK